MSSLTMRFHADYIFGEELEWDFEDEYDTDSSFIQVSCMKLPVIKWTLLFT